MNDAPMASAQTSDSLRTSRHTNVSPWWLASLAPLLVVTFYYSVSLTAMLVVSVLGVAIAASRQTRPCEMLLLLTLVFGLLPAAPGVREASNEATNYTKFAYPLLVFAIGYFIVSELNGTLNGRAATLGMAILFIGFVSTELSTDPLAAKTFTQTVLVPVLIFIGLLANDSQTILAVWTILRRLLFLACLIGVAYYLYYAGPAGLSPSFAFGHHYDQTFQGLIGKRSYGNPNNASVVYLTALGLGLHNLRDSKSRKGLAALAVLIEASAVLMTGSTGAVFSAVLLGLVAMLQKVHSSAVLLRLYITVLITGIGLAIWRLGYANLGSTSGAGPRLDARAIAVHVIPSHFWIGNGPGSSGYVIVQQLGVAIGVDLTGSYTSAHDMFLNWGLDFGVPSMILLVTAVVVAISRTLRGNQWTLILPLLGFLLGAESSGIPIVLPSNPAWSVLLWTLLGLGWATSRRAIQSGELSVRNPKSPRIALASTTRRPTIQTSQ